MHATSVSNKPLLITMGCPVGIGPEIICRYTQLKGHLPLDQIVVLGNREVLTKAAKLTGADLPVRLWQPGEKLDSAYLAVHEVDTPDVSQANWGMPTAQTGKAMALYIEKAVTLLLHDQASALVTCPISKESLHTAGYTYPGHTEMLATLTKSQHVRMMMAGPRLKVVLVTIHEAIRQVPEKIQTSNIIACIAQTLTSLKEDFGIAEPRLAVAALNPHGGEGGLFGSEEKQQIGPAIQAFSGKAQVSGPWPPDTIFYQAAHGVFDAVVAMYHDQGLIPFKLLHFDDGVNCTLGLPIVRTSVDHGTAYDIAGKGVARPTSLAAALTMARNIARNRGIIP